ncbi:protein ASPARTIC PROTEASE IN GUARD CELL 2-like [Hibiscus syriacus]|uniref:protein ASPARTIC PROTEASE IN GUARD CELL 2-like n=1 Tax=Hibiscus syriacus TaxID=106335 RepID=UPI001923C117|nr:protein ASPARTIC PROTEASE IN GUARD CELL 2-like [Hibiscus syriacus]
MLTILAALLHLTLYSICVTAATSYLDLQLLNVNQTLMGTKMFKFKPLETSEFHHLSNVSEIDDHRGEWELKLVHRDKLSSGVNSTFHHDRGRRFHARIKKDVKRVASLLLRLPGGRTHEGEAAYECQPCNKCYRQSDPIFNAADSASFTGISCGYSVCDRVQNLGCNAGRSCRYEVSYGDGSYTKRTLALETLTFGRTVVKNVAI